MMSRTILLGSLVLACTVLSPGAEARTLAAIRAAGTLRVGLTGDYAPYALRTADGGVIGADVTMAKTMAADFHVRLEIVATTWKTMAADFQAGRFDVAMGGVSVTPDRAAQGLFSVPVMQDGKRPIVRCADRTRYTSLAAIDRPDVRLVVDPGGTNERFDKAHFPHARLEENPDNQAAFGDVAADRADVMITDGAEVDFQARRHAGVLCPAEVPQPFDRFEKAYWMTPDPILKAAVDVEVRRSLDDGDYRRALAW